MGDIIFLLSNNPELTALLSSLADEDCEIVSVNKSNLMIELYKKNPSLLIADIDSYGDQIVNIIQTILSLYYVPIVYVQNEKSEVTYGLQDEMLLTYEQLRQSIPVLFRQSTIFKKRYDLVMESYSAIGLLNSVVNGLLKKQDGIGVTNCRQIANDLINVIYAQNNFLYNKPEDLFVFEKNNNTEMYNAMHYKLELNRFELNAEINFDASDGFQFDLHAENGFSKNFNVNELSDISFSSKIFPTAIKPYLKDINNFAGYAIGNIIFIGMNFINKVTNYDCDIMKALTIHFDLVDTIRHQMGELEEAFDYTIDALARAAEVNDDITGHHIKRVNFFAKRLSEELNMDPIFINRIESAAQMHDVGKIYVDKEILCKPDRLTPEEFEHIKLHTIYGEKIIGSSERLKMAVEVSRSHHEKYDGTGYPDGKKGEEIPMSARIVFLADIYDALRSDRPYKPGFSHDKAYEIITIGDGRVMPQNFDPKVLDAFKRIHLEFDTIYEELRD